MEKNKFDINEPNKTGVLNYMIDSNHFLVVMSNFYLLRAAKDQLLESEAFCCQDATYKLLECDFPYTIFGIGRKFEHKFNIVATLISDKENEDSYNFLQ